LKELPDTEVVTFVADVKDPVSAEEAVKVTKSRFGRLDVLVANAGVTSPVNERRSPVLMMFCERRAGCMS
jgi:NADP-dependent 3-hydroxy acid dehydrogenase YdfG